MTNYVLLGLIGIILVLGVFVIGCIRFIAHVAGLQQENARLIVENAALKSGLKIANSAVSATWHGPQSDDYRVN